MPSLAHDIEAAGRSRRMWLRVLGLGPLAVFACFHAWQGWAALSGREAWVDRMRGTGLGFVFGAALLAVFGVHGALGLRKWWDSRSAGQAGSADSLRDPWAGFQLVTAILLFAFLICHLWQVWPPEQGPHVTVRSAYDVLWNALGRPFWLVVYVIGTSALVFHLATGCVRAIDSSVGATASRSRVRLARYLIGAGGVVLWLCYLQVVGHFAIGEGIFPTASKMQAGH